ncbi:MAG TPA: glutamate synthase subunit alpha, partial [Anaerolineae bacterium]
PVGQPRRYMGESNPVLTRSPLNEQLLSDAWAALHQGLRAQFDYRITNRDRTFGARLSGVIAGQYGDAGLPDGTFEVRLHGSAGQSLGAFNVPGLALTVCGEANDYVGKGMTGGRIVIYPLTNPNQYSETPVLAGNTLLYGATGGELFIAGKVGERFAVRNSGALAVVEGVGDHGCEYMTGGLAVILGSIGYNFAAGMTGGIAYIYDEDGHAAARINTQLVHIEKPSTEQLYNLHDWVARHAQLTVSQKAQAILSNWDTVADRFLRIVPNDLPTQAEPVPMIPLVISQPVLR